jgi:hypothetical protein
MDSKERGLIRSHELQDIYRLNPGVILVVNKFKQAYSLAHSYFNKEKAHLERQKDLKDARCFKLTSDVEFEVYEDCVQGFIHKTFPKGTYIFNGYIVEKIPPDKVREYNIALKLSGGMCYGSLADFNIFINQLVRIDRQIKGRSMKEREVEVKSE